MATKVGYVPTSVSGKLSSNSYAQNGTVYKTQNLRDQGYPNYYGSSSGGGGGSSSGGSSSGRKSGGGSSSGSASAASAANANATNANAADAYNALLAAYKQNDYSDYLRQQREAAQRAYDRGMETLNNAYNSQMSSLSSNLGETRNQLANQYNRSKQNITNDAASSLRQAYINRMLSEKNLGQQMSALGLSGGATETTLANMANSYGNARNNINTVQNRNLSNLEGNYSDSLAQAMQAYNSAVASANMQKAQQQMALENALANNEISALGNYQSLMQNENQNYLNLLKAAIANGASFQYTPTEATNDYNAIAVQQATNPTLGTNYQAIQELLNSQNVPGTNTPGMTVVNSASSGNYLADILAKLAANR